MSDAYIPGIQSRLGSDKLIEDLMRLERVPRDRAESNIERYETQKGYWQSISTRISALRESARQLFSFNNPFNEFVARSSDDSVLVATASRTADEQIRSFTVKQVAASDRFLSNPLQEDFHVEGGTYTFSIGSEDISLDFRGGTLTEFTDALNRRSRDKLQASLVAVKPGTKSLFIESKVTGEENRLSFANAAVNLGVSTGMLAVGDDGQRALNPISTAQDSIITMEGIQIQRSSNEISDLVPGVTIKAMDVSDKAVRINIQPDRESIKDAIISFVGNYNRVLAEINLLTLNDIKVIEELSYLSVEEAAEYRKNLAPLAGDTTLMQMRNSLTRIMGSPYETSQGLDMVLLVQIGIGTDVRRSGGGSTSQLRGYLEIDEKALDAAIATNLNGIRQLFAYDTDGDLVADTGIAYSIDLLTRPYVETGGLLAQKTNNMDSRISQEQQRIATIDRQLAAKEADLKKQYAQMESAYSRMEQMTTSFDRFSQQNSNNNNR
jgi:flagellar hook-associated protein 2